MTVTLARPLQQPPLRRQAPASTGSASRICSGIPRLDDTEEQKLIPEKKVFSNFGARARAAQSSSGPCSTESTTHAARTIVRRCSSPSSNPRGRVCGAALESPALQRRRDIGVVANLPKKKGTIVLPMSGDVAHSTRRDCWARQSPTTVMCSTIDPRSIDRSSLGGEASVATNGF